MNTLTSYDLTANEERDLVITRVLNAPRELVFKTFTEPTMMAKWWGPHQFTNPVCEIDAREGGDYRIVMQGPDGNQYPMSGVIVAIESPERIVWLNDANEHPDEWHEMMNEAMRKRGEDVAPGSKSILKGLLIYTFEDQAGKTLLTIRAKFESVAQRDAMIEMGMSAGWAQSLERLEELLTAV